MAGPPGLRVLFLGTPEFAVPSLRALAESRHSVVGVISQPDRPRGRGRKLVPTPVHVEARSGSLPLLQPEKVGDPEVIDWIRELGPDLGCVVAFGQFIPRRVRDLPPQRMINAHASLLPRFRGAAPIEHAILAGEARTGITVIRVEREMDAGDWCLLRETPILPDETADELAARLKELAAGALVEAVDLISRGEARFRPQPGEGVTLAPKLGREFGRLELGEPVERVLRRIRAATPWPGVDVELYPGGRRLRILRAQAGPAALAGERPGDLRVEGGRLWIAAGGGWLEVLRVQEPGRRVIDAAEFLRGARLGEQVEVRSV